MNKKAISTTAAVALALGTFAGSQIPETPEIVEVEKVIEVQEKDKIGNVLKYVSPKEKAKVKAQIMKEKAKVKKYKKNDVDFEIVSVSYKEEKNILCAVVKAKKNKPLSVNNPLCFYNPPIRVSTGAFDEEGNEIFEENPEEAFKEIIYQTVKLQNNL